jgi:sugar phosphate isomerase/epimerase
MKLANGTWCWTPFPEDMPSDDSLFAISEAIRKIGFEGIDYLGTDESLAGYYNKETCLRLGERARSIGLEPNVMGYHASKNWNDPDRAVRRHLADHFRKCAQAASWIGCHIVSTIVPKAYGAKPWRLNPRAAAQKEAFHLPDDYDYQRDWDNLRSAYAEALGIAKDFGLKFSIECFIFSMVSTPHAMLQLRRDIGDPDFGIQLDTNHLIAQRIDPEWTIYMLGGKSIFNVHCKDHDMLSRGNIPAGCGLTDYTEVIRALRAVGYDGNLTVELEFTDNPARYNRQAYEHLKKCLAGEY